MTVPAYSVLGIVVLAYLIGVTGIGWWIGRRATLQDFYLARRRAPWLAVAIGMIGTTLSGITFLSVPAWVITTQWKYFQMVLGYFVGYLIIAYGLLPFYYRTKGVTIYERLRPYVGLTGQRVAAIYFFLARWVGASLRLYLVAWLLHELFFQPMGFPFALTVALTLLCIWLYSSTGGIRTLIWTDLLQTLVMLFATVGIALFLWTQVKTNPEAPEYLAMSMRIWDWSPLTRTFFGKYFLSGILIALVMTGLDQDMMQKNLACRNLPDAQKNMLLFATLLLPVKLLFLAVGALALTYLHSLGMRPPSPPEKLLLVALFQTHAPLTIQILFLLGLLAAALSSADSALTALTTSLQRDLGFPPRRRLQFALLALLVFLFAVTFYFWHQQTIIHYLFRFTVYLYGPLLGLFAWLALKKKEWRSPAPMLVILACVCAPLITWLMETAIQHWTPYEPAYEFLGMNGFITWFILYIGTRRGKRKHK